MQKSKRGHYESIKFECQLLQDMVISEDLQGSLQDEKQILISTILIGRSAKAIMGKKVKYNGVRD